MLGPTTQSRYFLTTTNMDACEAWMIANLDPSVFTIQNKVWADYANRYEMFIWYQDISYAIETDAACMDLYDDPPWDEM